MIKKDKLVLFGPPGVGKSTVAKLLGEAGYYYFDGDAHSLPEGVALNRQGRGMTPELRDREYNHIFDEFLAKTREHNNIVLDYHIMFDRYRVDLRQRDIELRWVYLTAPFIAVADRLDRPGHLLNDLEFIQRIFSAFEEPSFEVRRINASLPVQEVVQQVLDF